MNGARNISRGDDRRVDRFGGRLVEDARNLVRVHNGHARSGQQHRVQPVQEIHSYFLRNGQPVYANRQYIVRVPRRDPTEIDDEEGDEADISEDARSTSTEASSVGENEEEQDDDEQEEESETNENDDDGASSTDEAGSEGDNPRWEVRNAADSDDEIERWREAVSSSTHHLLAQVGAYAGRPHGEPNGFHQPPLTERQRGVRRPMPRPAINLR